MEKEIKGERRKIRYNIIYMSALDILVGQREII